MLCYIILYHIILYYIVLHYIILYYIISYHIILYYICVFLITKCPTGWDRLKSSPVKAPGEGFSQDLRTTQDHHAGGILNRMPQPRSAGSAGGSLG